MPDNNVFEQSFPVKGGDFANAGEASCQVKEILKEIGVGADIIRRVAIAAYEAEMNVVMYAREGEVRVSISPEMVNLIIEDEGQGIENIDLAMQEGYSTATEEMREMGFGAGMGLPNMKKNSDEFKVTSEVGKGTKIDIRIRMEKET
ncbi:MAG: ATP-binding protein [Gemmatimonadota bacterium]|nr:MAG: ATP-binding protein [Gemmatimonadota bacterium]